MLMTTHVVSGGHGGAERRQYPRLSIALDVAFGLCGISQRPPEDQLERTVTVYLSTGGMCLYTDILYPVGTQLFCALSLPGCPKPLELITTVARFQKVPQEAHGYKLGVEFVELSPAHKAQLERVILEPPASHATRAKKLLLVDDDAEFMLALKVRLQSVGFQVLTATEGMEALEKSRLERPNLIILDLMLPKLNGYEVCRLLKFDQKFHHIPIILLTARSRQEDKELGYSVGADAYVTKPFDGNTLLEKVDELLVKTSNGH